MQLRKNGIPRIQLKLFDIARYWLISVLLIMPFQPRIANIILSWNSRSANAFNKLDELTIVFYLPLAFGLLYQGYKKGEINFLPYNILLLPIVVMSFTGVISGLLNNNSLLITAQGIFSYIKNFLLIFIFAAFFRDIKTLQKIFQVMFIIAVGVGIISIAHELWAMYIRYINYDLSNFVFNSINKIMAGLTGGAIEPLNWRMGIYRTPSIMVHYNLLGFYSVFILTIYLSITKNINMFSLSTLFAGVLLSVSRLAYLSFAFLAGWQAIKGRRFFMVLLIPILPLLLYAFFIANDVDEITMPQKTISGAEMSGSMLSHRDYARSKSLEVWKNYPLFGVGPGMFGGDVAVKHNSPLYEEYNAFTLLKYATLDQVWPQTLAEMGIIGTTAFAGLLVSLIITFILLRQRAVTETARGLFAGLAVFSLFIIFNTFTNSLNNAPLLFPYCAVAGMGLGCEVCHSNA